MKITQIQAGTYTNADLQNYDRALRQLSGGLMNQIKDLTPEERRAYGSINEQNKLIVNKVADMLNDYPHLIPPTFDTSFYAQELADFKDVESILQRLESDTYKLESLRIMKGYNAYQHALAYYHYMAYMADHLNDTDARSIYNELKPLVSNAPKTPKDAAKDTDANKTATDDTTK